MQANSKGLQTSSPRIPDAYEPVPTRLIAFAVSHYCEKARWALERLSIPFIEERHVPGFHWLFTVPKGGKSVPLLLTVGAGLSISGRLWDDSGKPASTSTFTDSTDILHYLDTLAPTSHRLYPTDPELRGEVETLEDLFDTGKHQIYMNSLLKWL